MYDIKKEAKFIPFKEISPNLLNKKIIKKLKEIKDEIIKNKLENAKIEKIAEKIFDFKVVKINNEDCSGYCNYEDKIIGLENNPKKTILRKKVFCHELGHVILYDLKIDSIKLNTKKRKLLSYQVYIEQMAETISFYLFDILFPGNIKQKEKLNFNYYFSKIDHETLLKWYKDQNIELENDLIP